jgi:hypothetical protein
VARQRNTFLGWRAPTINRALPIRPRNSPLVTICSREVARPCVGRCASAGYGCVDISAAASAAPGRRLVTPDSHVHFTSPTQVHAGLAARTVGRQDLTTETTMSTLCKVI